MEIKVCVRCGKEWCYRGIGRPVRCGKCKSPYWDKERKYGNDELRGARGGEGGSVGGSGNGASVPVLRKGKSKAKRLHEMPDVRKELAGGGGFDERPETEPHEGHRTSPYGDKRWCSDCQVYYSRRGVNERGGVDVVKKFLERSGDAKVEE